MLLPLSSPLARPQPLPPPPPPGHRIHVADPTRWLHPGDALDSEARRRSRTLYLPWGYVPMFPRELARGPFSLLAGGGQQVRRGRGGRAPST